MEDFCRACLIKQNEPTDLLQYTEKNRRLFIYSTGLQVKRGDILPFQLCKECYMNMKIACKFKKQCRTSEKRFKNYLSLREVDENMDFCTYLKNSDDSLTFKFPMSGYSTPAHQKDKDEDNVSTCTSIRNFMTDILQGEEMQDTEARIIQEVIEEEADILDDSLDSHWLQDDASIDTDFRLDFSLSPFSSPRSFTNDHCYTPMKMMGQNKDKHIDKYLTSQNLLEKSNFNSHEKVLKNEKNRLKADKIVEEKYDENIQIDDNREITTFESKLGGITPKNYYVEYETLPENDVQLDTVLLEKSSDNYGKCTIDTNLNNALKDESNKEISLVDLLMSPPVFLNNSSPSTPTITNILFGDKQYIRNVNITTNTPSGKHIEQYENVQSDTAILEDFFTVESEENSKDVDMIKQETKNFIIELTEEEAPQIESPELAYNLTYSECNICNRQFKNNRSLKTHLVKMHFISIPDNKIYNKPQVCPLCGKKYTDRANYARHKKTHKEPNLFQKDVKKFVCKICSLSCTTEGRLERHMGTHTGIYVTKDIKQAFVCSICGVSISKYHNYQLHLRRHNKEYSFKCADCGKGFYRSTDFACHMRSHSGEQPFACEHCDKKFSRGESLRAHLTLHSGQPARFQCENCKKFLKRKASLVSHIKSCYTKKIKLIK